MYFILKQTPRAFSGIIQRKSTIYLAFKTGIGERSSSSHIGENNINKYLKLAFTQADKDKDGQVTAEEMRQVIKMFFVAKGKPENAMVYNFFDKMIFQNNKTLGEEELLSRVNHSFSFLKEFGLELFKNKLSQFDLDKDGKLNKEEISNLLEHLHPFADKEKVDNVMSTYDKDQDGKVSVEELMEFAKKELFNVKL